MACKYLYARIAALRVLGPSSAWFRIALARMSRASSSGVCGGSAVGAAAGSWVSCSGGSCVLGRLVGVHAGSYSPAIEEVDEAGALPLDWVRIAAGLTATP